MWQLLQRGTQLHIPESDCGIASPTSEQTSVGRKGQTVVAFCMPTLPEQSTTLDIPQLEATIRGAAGEQAFIWAEGKGPDEFGVGLPGQVQTLTRFTPYPHFPSLAPSGPILSARADCDCPDGIEGL